MGFFPLYSLYFALRRFPIRVIRQYRDVLNRSNKVIVQCLVSVPNLNRLLDQEIKIRIRPGVWSQDPKGLRPFGSKTALSR
jgi:hypothetical protein